MIIGKLSRSESTKFLIVVTSFGLIMAPLESGSRNDKITAKTLMLTGVVVWSTASVLVLEALTLVLMVLSLALTAVIFTWRPKQEALAIVAVLLSAAVVMLSMAVIGIEQSYHDGCEYTATV
jgi:hypothetical protein